MTLSFPPIQMDRKTAAYFLSVGEVDFINNYHPHLPYKKDGKKFLYLRSDIEELVKKKHKDLDEEPSRPMPGRKKPKRQPSKAMQHLANALIQDDEFERAAAVAQGRR